MQYFTRDGLLPHSFEAKILKNLEKGKTQFFFCYHMLFLFEINIVGGGGVVLIFERLIQI
jgi:hypothetical protein